MPRCCERGPDAVVIAPISLNETAAVNEEQYRCIVRTRRRGDVQVMFFDGIGGIRDVFCRIDRGEKRKDHGVHIRSLFYPKGRAYL